MCSLPGKETEMKSLIGISLVASAAAVAATTVLDPGPGTQYLAPSCGGQSVSEAATGFDASGFAQTQVEVRTTCHGSGRGAKSRTYVACWALHRDLNTVIVGKENILSGSYLAGSTPVACPAVQQDAVYRLEDGSGNLSATLSTIQVQSVYGQITTVNRAVLDTP
jgi:hypothetical protein